MIDVAFAPAGAAARPWESGYFATTGNGTTVVDARRFGVEGRRASPGADTGSYPDRT